MGGGDFNCNMFERSERAYLIRDILSEVSGECLPPCETDLLTYRKWGDVECTHLLDGFVVSSSIRTLTEHAWSQGRFAICSAVAALTESNHDPIEVHFNLENLIRYQGVRKGKQVDVSRKASENQHKFLKNWSPSQEQLKQYQVDMEHLATAGRLQSVDQINQGMISCGAQLKSKNNYRYRDCADLKQMCQMRNETKNSVNVENMLKML